MNTSVTSRARRVVRDAERGVSAVILALSMTVMMGAAAIGFDIAKLYYERQMVRNAVDAAAQAGASQLPTSGATAAGTLRTTVKSVAALNFSDLPAGNITVTFLCVVANTTGIVGPGSNGGRPDSTQIPTTCNPGSAYLTDTSQYSCSATSCAIKCADSAVCNAASVQAWKSVPFVFAPAININSASTGAVTTVSCRGSCGGQAPPNPMNVVVMADRTPSMNENYGAPDDQSFPALKSGIEGMLKNMTPSQQYVAFGALHKSTTITNTSGADDLTQPLPAGGKIFNETTGTICTGGTDYWGNCKGWGTGPIRTNEFAGVWVPVDFTKTYQSVSGTLATNTDLYQSVHNLTYSNVYASNDQYFYNKLVQSNGTYANSGTGTHLASALKGAARYLLGSVSTNNTITSLDTDGYRASLNVPIKNVIIFETDGQPDEVFTDASSDSATPLALTNSDDIGSTTTSRACANFTKVANEVKAAGILLVTIGFAGVNTASCGSGNMAKTMLAAAASTQASVTGSGSADHDCTDTSTNGGVYQENHDNDYYYCAASADDLKTVFAAAMGSITGTTKFMSIDGLTD